MTEDRTKTRTRKSKKQAKGTDDQAERTVEGVAFTPAIYEPGDVQRGDHDVTGYYPFKIEQLEFLKEFAKDCDHKRAGKAVGASPATIKKWMVEEKFRAEIMEIHDVWRLNWKMTAENAAAKHINLMEQLEKDYHQLDVEDRSKMANPLVKASETYLRAAGHFTHGGSDNESQVVINIDLGGDPDNEKKVKIEGKKKND